ncbi:HIV Tat-specific factor 1 homolog [Papaver somniferum]|uniref:HIV Tat-specific factor 1 homolog n=1 Tax=Papaver somniferum TaxID=3469 RepID=UPI000E702490|nr:HIV Tat-specific factor 1 homolog [Papaver somniferum]
MEIKTSLKNNQNSHLADTSSTKSGYKQAKNLSLALQDQEIEKLRRELLEELDRRAMERIQQKREAEEQASQEMARHRSEEEILDALFEVWKVKHFDREYRKEDEGAARAKRPKGVVSATDSDSDEESENGFEYPIEEMNTSDEDSDTVDDRKRMEAYLDRKLRRRFDDERAQPTFFSRTMQEGETSADEEILEDKSDESEGSDSDESSSSDDNPVSPASTGSEYNAQYSKEENWSYDGEDF